MSHPLRAPIIPLAITFCLHSVVTASLWLLFRFEDSDIRQQVIGMLCYSLAFWGSISFFYERYPSMWLLPIQIIVLILIPNILAFVPAFAFGILVGIGFVGLTLLILVSIRARCRLSIREYCLAIAIGIFTGVYHFLYVQPELYAHIFSDIGVYTNFISGDTLFHSAIVKMIQNFNVPSTGIDGVPWLFYHIGIHQWLAANLHYLAGLPVTLLGNSRDVLFIPIFMFSLSFAVLIASKSARWLVALTFVVIGQIIYSNIVVSKSHLVSESYLLSLPIFISFMPIGLALLENYYVRDNHVSGHVLFKQMFCTSLGIILCLVAKMSTGLIMTCYLAGCLIVPRFWDNPKYWWKLIVPSSAMITILLFLVKLFLLPRYDFKLFAFARTFLDIATAQVFIFAVCILAILIILEDETKLRKTIASLMATIFLIGQIPGLLFDIGGGSAGYFSEPTIWLSCFFLSSLALHRFQAVKVSLHTYKGTLLQILCFVLIVFTLYRLLRTEYGEFMKGIVLPINTDLKQALSIEKSPLSLDVPPDRKGSILDEFSRFRQRLVLGKLSLIERTELWRIKSIANKIGNNAKDTLIYVPFDSTFWKVEIRKLYTSCFAKSFAIPTVTGMPMLNGVRSGVGDCPFTEYYGMRSYTADSRNRELDPREMCQRANKLGFSKVLEIDQNSYQLHSCNLR